MPVHGLPPISDPSSIVLVLGTMPGKESLRMGRYYAHPRNVFWRLAGEILGFDPTIDYADRTARLVGARVALWDVLQFCTRESSLDSDIMDPIANDFVAFFQRHPAVTRVYFNGSAAEDLYNEHVLAGLARTISYQRLPSTSPANASLPYAEKLASWSAIKP
jgi:TDG/mug DNA glycosylase family protein